MKRIGLLFVLLMVTAGLLLASCAAPAATPAPAPTSKPAPAPTAAPAPAPTQASTPAPKPTAAPAAKPEPIVLKAVTFDIKGSPENLGLMLYADIVNKMSNGEVVIQYLGGPEAIPSFNQFEAMRNGVVDMIHTPESYYSALVSGTSIYHLLQVTPADLRKNGYYDYRRQAMATQNIQFLGVDQWGAAFNIWTKEPVLKISDMAGKKIRSSPYYIGFLKSMDAAPVILAPPDLYSALDRGVVNGFVWSTTGVQSGKWYEVCKNMIDINFFQASMERLINLDKWKSLPKSVQDMLDKAQVQAETDVRVPMQKNYDTERAFLEKAGVKYNKFSPEDTQKFLDMAYTAGWKDVMAGIKPAADGPKLKEFFSKK